MGKWDEVRKRFIRTINSHLLLHLFSHNFEYILYMVECILPFPFDELNSYEFYIWNIQKEVEEKITRMTEQK